MRFEDFVIKKQIKEIADEIVSRNLDVKKVINFCETNRNILEFFDPITLSILGTLAATTAYGAVLNKINDPNKEINKVHKEVETAIKKYAEAATKIGNKNPGIKGVMQRNINILQRALQKINTGSRYDDYDDRRGGRRRGYPPEDISVPGSLPKGDPSFSFDA
jgi:hypothetical protein